MLSVAKPILQQTIKSILGGQEVAKTFEEAYLQTLPLSDLDNIEDAGVKKEVKKQMEDTAEMFGKMCAAGLDKAITQKLTDAIDSYVKSIGIVATVTTVVSPAGPCTGALSPTDFNIL